MTATPETAAFDLPVLPLRDVVVFPHMVIPLFVGREKSVRALDEIMKGEKQILLATQVNAADDDPEPGAIYREPGVVPGILSLDANDIRQDVPVQAYAAAIPFLVVPLKSEAALSRVQFRREIWERTLRRFEASILLLFVLNEESSTHDASVRVLFPQRDPIEDAATEAAAGPLVRYIADHGAPSRPARRGFWHKATRWGGPAKSLFFRNGPTDEWTTSASGDSASRLVKVPCSCPWITERQRATE